MHELSHVKPSAGINRPGREMGETLRKVIPCGLGEEKVDVTVVCAWRWLGRDVWSHVLGDGVIVGRKEGRFAFLGAGED